MHLFVAALLAAIPAPGFSQPIPTAPAEAGSPQAELVPVAIQTSFGRIVVALDKTHAPISTANFLHYVDTHRYDGETFYRAMKTEGSSLIQGGVHSNALKLFAPIKHEPTSRTGLHNVAGAIVFANAGSGTARADFFILASDVPAFDATADDPGYAVFGHVVEGMDVVQKILNSHVSTTKGEGPLKGQMLDPPVKIVKMVREKQ